MAVNSKIILGVGMVAAVAVALVMANRQSQQSEPTMAAPISLAQAAANARPAMPGDATSSRKKLLFFMNPDGYPCQTQLSILNSVGDSLSKVAQVVYIKTTVPADMQVFEAYGIRALPSLVIADQDGREITRFAPGIQSSDAVLAALSR